MLKVDKIKVSYGSVRAVHGISFEVGKDETVILLGPNGAGKSTILKTISGLLRPEEGSILFEGRSIGGMRSSAIVRMGISQVAEGKRLFFEQSVMDNILLGGYVRWSRYRNEVIEDLERMFKRFPILGKKKLDLAGSLSGGEQQMLVIAQALMSRPKLLLLDEPSLGLAPKIVENIFQVIQELHQEGCTILLVEQRAQQALEICDKGYILETGLIIARGTGKELRESPLLKQAYLGVKANQRYLKFP